MTEFANKVINKIKSGEMKPKSKWRFKFRELSKWTLLSVFVISLGLVSALLWYFVADTNIRLSALFRCPLTVGYGPGLIIIFLVLVAFFSVLWMRRIKGSYRYNLILISSLLFIAGLILAVIFTHLGYGQRLDRSFSSLPLYQNQEQFMGSVWQQPDQGRIAGEIIRIESPTSFVLKDINGKEWLISSLNAVWRHNLSPRTGIRIKIEGLKTGDSIFEASDIRPWISRNKHCSILQSDQGPGDCAITR